MNLTVLLDMACDGFGNRLITGPLSGAFSVRELRDRAIMGADLIRQSGADSLVYLDTNSPAFPIAIFAAAYAGVPLVALNYRSSAERLEMLLARHSNALVLADADHEAVRDGVRSYCGRIISPAEWTAPRQPSASRPPAETAPREAPIVIYTSGTTSEPKAVLLRPDALVSYVFGSVEFGSAAERDAALVSVPPYHIAGVASVLTNLYAGRRWVTLQNFTPTGWLEAVRRERITSALVVPTMLARILRCDADKAVPTLVNLAYGGARMPSVLIEEALRLWPDVDFVNAYGLTETSSTVALLGPGDHRAALASDNPVVRARLASVGRPLPGIEIEIRSDDGAVVGPNEAGRIWLKGDQVSAEYAGLGKALDDREFFDTRDEGYCDADGYLFVRGRTDDTIIRGAENIAPAEIEDVLMRHQDVADAAVVGVPDDEWGERIVAIIVPRNHAAELGFRTAEIQAFVARQLRTSRAPDEVVYWPDLPRTDTGKLARREAQARLLRCASPDLKEGQSGSRESIATP